MWQNLPGAFTSKDSSEVSHCQCSSLNVYLHVHGLKKPYSCDQCGKCFLPCSCILWTLLQQIHTAPWDQQHTAQTAHDSLNRGALVMFLLAFPWWKRKPHKLEDLPTLPPSGQKRNHRNVRPVCPSVILVRKCFDLWHRCRKKTPVATRDCGS